MQSQRICKKKYLFQDPLENKFLHQQKQNFQAIYGQITVEVINQSNFISCFPDMRWRLVFKLKKILPTISTR